MFNIFKTRYKDALLSERAEQSLADNPTLDITGLDVTSENGLVTLRGQARSSTSKTRAVEIVRRALEQSGLKYQKIVDEIKAG